MKQYLIILIIIASSCSTVKNSGTEREVELVKKERVLESMYVSYRLTFSDGSKRVVNNSDAYLYVVGRCYLIK